MAQIIKTTDISKFGLYSFRFTDDTSYGSDLLTSGTNAFYIGGMPYLTVSAYLDVPYINSGTFVCRTRFYDATSSGLLATDTWKSITSANNEFTRYHTTYYSGIGLFTDNVKYADLQFGFIAPASGLAYLDGLKAEQSDHPTTWKDYPNLDTISDGNSFGKTLLTALTGNQVDFSKTGVINKTADNMIYTGGATVQSLKPAEASADVTSTHTSYDTARVNTVSSATVLKYNTGDGEIKQTDNTLVRADKLKDSTGTYTVDETIGPNIVGSGLSWNTITKNLDVNFSTYFPVSITETAGGTLAGTFDNLYYIDNNIVNIREASGTPGWSLDVNFSGVVAFNKIRLCIWYDGTAGHDVGVYLYNNTTLTNDLLFSISGAVGQSMTNYYMYDIDVPSPANYISVGAVKVVLIHSSAGSAAHHVYINQCILKNNIS